MSFPISLSRCSSLNVSCRHGGGFCVGDCKRAAVITSFHSVTHRQQRHFSFITSSSTFSFLLWISFSHITSPFHIPILRQLKNNPHPSALIFYTFPSTKLSHPGEESLRHSPLTILCNTLRPFCPFPLSAPQPTPLLQPHKPLAFPFCIVLRWSHCLSKKEKVGRARGGGEGGAEKKKSGGGQRGEHVLCSQARRGPPTSGCGNSVATSCFFPQRSFLNL